jgi:glycosyltransferase involved in cell wall biosynthesis
MARVVLFVNIPRFFLTHRLQLALAARDAGHEVHVLTAEDGSAHPATIRAAGLPLHTLPLRQHGASPLREATTLRAVHSAYRALRPDLVHHVGVKPAIYGGIAARATGVPATVCTLTGLGAAFTGHGAALRALRPIVRAGLGFTLRSPTTRVIFQNPENRDLFVARGIVPARQCRIIRGSGVDMHAFSPTPEEPGPPIVLFAGRVLWSKGVDDFVRAAERLRGKARFAIAALPEPNNPDAVPRATIEAWRDARLIEWWGQRSDMPAALRSVHVACLPTRYGEGVPKFLVEAAASGRAIVATNAPGCREVVRDGTNGFLVPPGDSLALSEALRRLIGDPTLRRRMGREGRALVENELSLERVNQDTLEVYAELLAQRAA